MRRPASTLTALVMVFALIPMAASARQCGKGFTPIYEIQGSGSASPLLFDSDHPQRRLTTVGVVTVDLQKNSEHAGFFLEDLDGDGDPSTSDGIFVSHRDTGFDVSEGDVIRIVAEVDEHFGRTQLENVRTIQVCGSATPAPLQITTRDFNTNPEQYEGMFLQYIGDLSVSDTFNLHRFGEIWVSDKGVIETPTNQFDPITQDEALDTFATDNMARVVMLEDGSRFSSPDPVPFLSGDGTLRLGDETTDPTGAIYFDFGNYKMVNSTDPDFTRENPRLDAPDVGGDLVVASFNVLNYWTVNVGCGRPCRGAQTPEQLKAQTDKLVAAILGMDADIVGLQEIENDSVDNLDRPIQALVNALNTAEGSDVWSRVDGFDQNVYPIVNEIIYRNDVVSPVDGAMTLVHPAFDQFRGDPPHDPDDQLGRRPVAQAFDFEGEIFTVVVNHFKSKSSTGATGLDEPQGDGQSAYNARRVQQAEAVLAWLPNLQTTDPDVLVIGDLNAYLMEEPITTLEEELINLLSMNDHEPDPYSFNFLAFFAAPHIGRGTLDHAFGTPEMAVQVNDVAIWHINADEPRFLDWFDPDVLQPGPYRSSDHDPVLIGLNLSD